MRAIVMSLAVAAVFAATIVSAQAQGHCPQFDGYPAWAYKALCPPTSG